MKTPFFTIFFLCFMIFGMAQQIKKPSSKEIWKTGGNISLVGAQSGTRNWAAGGEKFAFAASANLNLFANTSWRKNTWENNIDLAYALMYSTIGGVKKMDDKIDLYSIYNYGLKKKSAIGASINIRTQIYNGYDYAETPKRRTSGFFARAYINLGAGYNYIPAKSINILFGASARWIVVTNRPYSFNYQGGIKPDGTPERALATLYGVNPPRKNRFEMGPYISARLNKKVMKNVLYRTRLDLNYDFLHYSAYHVDIYWTNLVGMKVNDWLQVIYSLDMFYDDNVRMFGPSKLSSALQLKSILGVGLATRF